MGIKFPSTTNLYNYRKDIALTLLEETGIIIDFSLF